MVPEAYRLEQVSLQLVARLEGTRRSVSTDESRASVEFRRIAAEMVESAISEYGEVALESPEQQAILLRTEVMETFLPRYQRLALKMTAREEAGYGLGKLAEPLGRMVLVGVGVVLLLFGGRVLLATWLGWPVLLAILAIPFLPDLVRWVSRRAYRSELQTLVDDMETIQKQASAYTPADRLRVEPLKSPELPRPLQDERE